MSPGRPPHSTRQNATRGRSWQQRRWSGSAISRRRLSETVGDKVLQPRETYFIHPVATIPACLSYLLSSISGKRATGRLPQPLPRLVDTANLDRVERAAMTPVSALIMVKPAGSALSEEQKHQFKDGGTPGAQSFGWTETN